MSYLNVVSMKLLDNLIKKVMYSFNTSIKNKHIYAFFKYGSWKKFRNLLNVEIAILEKKTKNFGYPYMLTIEPTNICNLKCPLCRIGKGLIGRKKQNMHFKDFKKVVDEIGNYLYLINLYNWGEPLANPQIFDMIKYCHEKRMYASLATNGNYNTELNKKIIDSKLDHILFALDGSSKEIYGEYRVGGDFDLVVNNIKDLLKQRKIKKVRCPLIEIQFLVFKNNKRDIASIKKLARYLGVDGLLIRVGVAPGNEDIKKTYYAWDTKKGFCRRFWYCAVINCDGGVVPCCNFFYKKDDFGNVFSNKFYDIWNNSSYIHNRESILLKNFKKINKICKGCRKYDGGKTKKERKI